MMVKIFLLAIVMSLVTSCEYFIEEKEPEILLSKIDGEQYVEDMQSEINSRKNTRLIEESKFDAVSYDGLLNICDSLISTNDEWRPRYFGALNAHLSNSGFNIDPIDNQRFGIGIFNYFVFYPAELIAQFDNCSVEQVDFWNTHLGNEILRKEGLDGITEQSIIELAHTNCKECDEAVMSTIATMVKTLVLE